MQVKVCMVKVCMVKVCMVKVVDKCMYTYMYIELV